MPKLAGTFDTNQHIRLPLLSSLKFGYSYSRRGERELRADTQIGKDLEEGTIVSFDIPEEDRSRRSTIQRYLHGRIDRKNMNGIERTYRYPGLLDEGGFRLGQSVYLLPPDLASRLIVRLRELSISHHYWDVMVRS